MNIIRPFGKLPAFPECEQNSNFVQFIILNKILSESDIDIIRGLWDNNSSKEGKIAQGSLDHTIRKSNVIAIDPENFGWLYDKIARTCILVNASRYQFELTGFQSKLQLSNYEMSEFYGWHMDSGAGPSSLRKLSISIQLSDASEYQGGDLQFMTAKGEINAPKDLGTVIIFPSYVQHRVQPIISGTRKSLVGWIAGPPYR